MSNSQDRTYSLKELSPPFATPWILPIAAAVVTGALWGAHRYGKLPPEVAAWLEPSLLVIYGLALLTGLGLVWEWISIGRWAGTARRTRGLSPEELLRSDAWPARACRNCTQRAAQEWTSLDPDSVKSVVSELASELCDYIGRRWMIYLALAFATSLAGALSGAWNLKDSPEGVALAQGMRHCAVGVAAFFACLLGIVWLSLTVRGALREWQNHVCQLSRKIRKLAELSVPEPVPPQEVVPGRAEVQVSLDRPTPTQSSEGLPSGSFRSTSASGSGGGGPLPVKPPDRDVIGGSWGRRL